MVSVLRKSVTYLLIDDTYPLTYSPRTHTGLLIQKLHPAKLPQRSRKLPFLLLAAVSLAYPIGCVCVYACVTLVYCWHNQVSFLREVYHGRQLLHIR